MFRVMTFAKTFPKYHPNAGEPTHFKTKIEMSSCFQPNSVMEGQEGEIHYVKFHTIRAGHRWNVGEMFLPRQWSEMPYTSKQESLGEDMTILKIWGFMIDIESDGSFSYWILGDRCQHRLLTYYELKIIAQNDGLTLPQFIDFFTSVPRFKGFAVKLLVGMNL